MNSLEFTGERYIPGQGGAQISYEHLHRYLYAARWANGKAVLDVAAGAGYGAALLAQRARAVWAADLDGAAVAHARSQCPVKNVSFLQADATLLPFPNGSAGLVVALEILEHVADPGLLVRELARVAGPEALVFISTPNKAVYSDARAYSNPYHVHEFYREELLDLLTRSFTFVSLLTQQVRSGSLIAPENRMGRAEILTEPRPDAERGVSPAMYFLALCAHSAPPEIPPVSAYLDPSNLLFSEWDEEAKRLNREIAQLGVWGATLRNDVHDRDGTIQNLQNEIHARDRMILDLNGTLEQRDQTIIRLQQEFEVRTRWVEELQNEIARRDGQLVELNRISDERDREIHRLAAELGHIRRKLIYKVFARLGLFPS